MLLQYVYTKSACFIVDERHLRFLLKVLQFTSIA
jgi:hypothetical protein